MGGFLHLKTFQICFMEYHKFTIRFPLPWNHFPQTPNKSISLKIAIVVSNFPLGNDGNLDTARSSLHACKLTSYIFSYMSSLYWLGLQSQLADLVVQDHLRISRRRNQKKEKDKHVVLNNWLEACWCLQ